MLLYRFYSAFTRRSLFGVGGRFRSRFQLCWTFRSLLSALALFTLPLSLSALALLMLPGSQSPVSH